jgi:hypothetical protein
MARIWKRPLNGCSPVRSQSIFTSITLHLAAMPRGLNGLDGCREFARAARFRAKEEHWFAQDWSG